MLETEEQLRDHGGIVQDRQCHHVAWEHGGLVPENEQKLGIHYGCACEG